MCHVVSSPDLGDVDFDAKLNVRTIWETEENRRGVSERSQALQDPGLSATPSPLESKEISFDVTTQIPPEPLHAELLGIGLLALSLWLNAFVMSARTQVNTFLRTLQLDTPWPQFLPQLIKKYQNVEKSSLMLKRSVGSYSSCRLSSPCRVRTA
jgi:hypothetical protein